MSTGGGEVSLERVTGDLEGSSGSEPALTQARRRVRENMTSRMRRSTSDVDSEEVRSVDCDVMNSADGTNDPDANVHLALMVLRARVNAICASQQHEKIATVASGKLRQQLMDAERQIIAAERTARTDGQSAALIAQLDEAMQRVREAQDRTVRVLQREDSVMHQRISARVDAGEQRAMDRAAAASERKRTDDHMRSDASADHLRVNVKSNSDEVMTRKEPSAAGTMRPMIIVGRVTDSDGKPAAGARVRATIDGRAGDGVTLTDARGDYRLVLESSSDTATVTVTAPPNSDLKSYWRTVLVRRDDDRIVANFKLNRSFRVDTIN